ncbi:MAG TPA: hypothetical protein VIZ63_23670 [Povalibacter sp.]
MSLDDRTRDVQSKTQTTTRIVIDLPELLEYVWQRQRRDAGTVVIQRERDVTRLSPRMQIDSTSAWRELHGVAEQVRQYLHDAVVVEECVDAADGYLDREGYISAREHRLIGSQYFEQERTDVVFPPHDTQRA